MWIGEIIRNGGSALLTVLFCFGRVNFRNL